MILVAISFLSASYYGLKLTKYAPTKEDIDTMESCDVLMRIEVNVSKRVKDA